jgi:hypothetical protein
VLVNLSIHVNDQLTQFFRPAVEHYKLLMVQQNNLDFPSAKGIEQVAAKAVSMEARVEMIHAASSGKRTRSERRVSLAT